MEDKIDNEDSKVIQNEISVDTPEKKKFNYKIVIIAAIVGAILIAAFYFKAVFIAATVNGSPITRTSVIKELEKQSGKQALDSLITKKLVEKEVSKKNINITAEEVDAEIKKIEKQVTSQGGTLNDALAQQGLTAESLREQIILQKKLEKILADKTQVSDEDIEKYIADNKITPPEGQKIEEVNAQVKEQLTKQKFSTEAKKWIDEAKKSANIKYFVDYGNAVQ